MADAWVAFASQHVLVNGLYGRLPGMPLRDQPGWLGAGDLPREALPRLCQLLRESGGRLWIGTR